MLWQSSSDRDMTGVSGERGRIALANISHMSVGRISELAMPSSRTYICMVEKAILNGKRPWGMSMPHMNSLWGLAIETTRKVTILPYKYVAGVRMVVVRARKAVVECIQCSSKVPSESDRF